MPTDLRCGPPQYDAADPTPACGEPATRSAIYVDSAGYTIRRPCCDKHPIYADVGSHSFHPLRSAEDRAKDEAAADSIRAGFPEFFGPGSADAD